jgi:hypothetical protein
MHNVLFVTVQEHFGTYCGYRETVKLFKYLLSPWSLVGILGSVQSCKFC